MNTHGKDFYYIFLNFQITIESIEIQNPYIKHQQKGQWFSIDHFTYKHKLKSYLLAAGKKNKNS